jgi:hypothetical protein
VIFMGKPEGKRPLERPRCGWVDGWMGGWVDNIKMHLRYIGWGSTDWIDWAQGRDQ